MNINLKEKIKNATVFFGQGKRKYHDGIIGRNTKKSAIFRLLFIFALSIFIPISNAHAIDPIGWAISTLTGGIGDVAKGIFEIFLKGLNVIIYNIGNFALNIAGQLVHFGAWLVDLTMDQNLYKAVLVDSSAIKVGWETIRDFCNMFFIFFLLVVAFATILRISEYSAKTILPKFLIAIFMINFSMEITKIVIDFGQVFLYEIRGWMGDFSGTTGGGSSLTSIVDYFNDYFNASVTSITADASIAVLFAATYSFMLGFTYIMMAGFLLIRLLMFAVLIILSPFAFFCNVFPGTRRYASEWWGSIVKYSLFGPIFIFFVFISATMAFELTSSYNPATVAPGGYEQIEAVKGLIPKLIPNIIALMMLWMAIPVTQKLGVAGSSRLIGGTLGLGTVAMASYGATKLAGGWGRKAAGGVASRTPLGERYDKVRDAAERRVIAKIPVIGKGIVMKNMASREKEKEEKMKKMEVEFGDLKNIDLGLLKDKANGIGLGKWKTGTTDDKALLLKAAAAQGKLGDKDDKGNLIYGKYLNEAERSMSKNDLKQITNKSLTLEVKTNGSQERINAARGDSQHNNPKVVTGMTDEENAKYRKLTTDGERASFVEEQIKREKMRDLVKDGKAHEVQDLDDKTTAKVWKEVQNSDQLKSSTARMTEEQREKLQIGYMKNTIGGGLDPAKSDYATKLASEKAEIAAEKASTNPDVKKAAEDKEKDDSKFRTEAINAGRGLEEAFKSCADDIIDAKKKEEEITKRIANEFGKLEQKRVAKLNDTELAEYGYLANTSQTRFLNREGKQDKLSLIMKSKDDKLKKDGLTNADYQSLVQKRKDMETKTNKKEKEKLQKEIDILEKKASVTELVKLEKGIDDIESMITGDKY